MSKTEGRKLEALNTLLSTNGETIAEALENTTVEELVNSVIGGGGESLPIYPKLDFSIEIDGSTGEVSQINVNSFEKGLIMYPTLEELSNYSMNGARHDFGSKLYVSYKVIIDGSVNQESNGLLNVIVTANGAFTNRQRDLFVYLGGHYVKLITDQNENITGVEDMGSDSVFALKNYEESISLEPQKSTRMNCKYVLSTSNGETIYTNVFGNPTIIASNGESSMDILMQFVNDRNNNVYAVNCSSSDEYNLPLDEIVAIVVF